MKTAPSRNILALRPVVFCLGTARLRPALPRRSQRHRPRLTSSGTVPAEQAGDHLNTPAVAEVESYGRAVNHPKRASRTCHLDTLNSPVKEGEGSNLGSAKKILIRMHCNLIWHINLLLMN